MSFLSWSDIFTLLLAGDRIMELKQLADGSLPVQSVCHQNVDRFIKENSGYKVVRGWVTYADFGLSVGLTAHSVIQDRDGQLIDITPLGNERDRPGMRFVRHIGTEQEFRSMRDCGISIECPIGR